MKRAASAAAAFVAACLAASCPRDARADASAQDTTSVAPKTATVAVAPAPPSPSRKRPVPDYDGRGGPRPTAGEQALWVPRVLLSPVYLVTEYVLRRPLGVAVPAAESADLPRKLYDLVTFGPRHELGVVPVAFVEFNFNPSVGVYAFWDHAGFEANHLRLHAEAWPSDWMAANLTERVDLDRATSLQLRVSGVRRPDRVFYGLGPSSRQANESRYGEERFEAGAALDWRFWRSSHVQTALGLRDERTFDGYYGTDPALTQQVAAGAFALPDGFGKEYTVQYNRIVAAVDTRVPQSRPRSGARLEVAAEQGSDVRRSPASGWVRYGATAAGFVDLDGYARVLGLSVTTLFSDPLGAGPVPFMELAYLGGDHPMPAYYAGRLIDRSAAAATASYTWPIAPWLDGRLELSAGNVFGPHLDSFDAKLLRFSGAFGLSIAGLQDPPLELLFGLGTETVADGAVVDSVRVALGVPRTF